MAVASTMSCRSPLTWAYPSFGPASSLRCCRSTSGWWRWSSARILRWATGVKAILEPWPRWVERWVFSVHVVDPIADDQGQPIRSTAVREALARGDVARVAVLLGRNFVLGGTVVTGAGRGAGLGFPTANLKIAKELALTGDGIYATWAHVGPRRYMAATSIGMRPTFEKGERTVEAFILDFDGDLYGQEVRLEFVRRLRDEVQFDSVSALQEQVDKDVDEAKAVLQGS